MIPTGNILRRTRPGQERWVAGRSSGTSSTKRSTFVGEGDQAGDRLERQGRDVVRPGQVGDEVAPLCTDQYALVGPIVGARRHGVRGHQAVDLGPVQGGAGGQSRLEDRHPRGEMPSTPSASVIVSGSTGDSVKP